MGKFLTKDSMGFERVVLGEVLIPGTVNVYGDFHTKENIREFAYWYMSTIGEWYIDRNHDGEELDDDNRVTIVESFIARDGDQDFIPGSWVLGTWIRDDEIWQQVLDGELNGYSWEAIIYTVPVEVNLPSEPVSYGYTEPYIVDGHKHKYFAILNEQGRVVVGGTSFDNGHYHQIRSHTFTEFANDHTHIINLIK